jgi:hypothetical protein
MGWQEDIDYILECKPYLEMLDEVLKNASVSGAFSAVAIDSNLIDAGHKLSQPSMENGLSFLGKGACKY